MLIVNERWLVFHDEKQGTRVICLDDLKQIDIDIIGDDNDIDNIKGQIKDIISFIQNDFN